MKYLRILSGKCEEDVEEPAITFPYKGDDFQRHSFNCISRDENVLVTAHTGSGKTAVAKYAIAHYAKKGRRVVYTSPIKALSNQKYKEFMEDEAFKEIGISIGLMTGDNKIKPDADCVIMTTEILRNALYDMKGESETAKVIYFEENFIESVGCVIFDEIHYINDCDRGHVWEETLIMLDPEVTIVGLSATIDKAASFARWIGEMKKNVVNLIPTTHRVVPLKHYVYGEKKLYKILDKDNKFIDDNYERVYGIHKKRRGNKLSLINELVIYMKENDLLQAIFFTFSRLNCEKYAKMINMGLLTHTERAEIERIFNKNMHKYEKQYSQLRQYNTLKELVMKGIAFHHSGLLPILKEIVEIIFQKGLIKVLFATETFAVGVNMPTKTIVFTELKKMTNIGRRELHTAEYRQMSGRAGRRGLDKKGTVIILPLYSMLYKEDIKMIMMGKLPHVESRFYINYSFIMKILQSNSRNMNQFIENTLFKIDNTNMIEQQSEEVDKLRGILKTMQNPFISTDMIHVKKYIKLEEQEAKYREMGLSLNKKQYREKQRLLRNISKEDYEKYREYSEMNRAVEEGERELDGMKAYINKESHILIELLERYGYLISGVDGDVAITMKGVICAHVNECNPLVLTEMFDKGLFEGLKAEEIVSLLGIFIDDVKPQDRRKLKDVKDITSNVKDRVMRVNEIIEKFIRTEQELGISFYHYGYWEIYYDYIDTGYIWATGGELIDILKIIDVYEGNFIRSMIKLDNIAHELINICKISGKLEIMPQLEEIDDKMIRNIVTVNSLYIH